MRNQLQDSMGRNGIKEFAMITLWSPKGQLLPTPFFTTHRLVQQRRDPIGLLSPTSKVSLPCRAHTPRYNHHLYPLVYKERLVCCTRFESTAILPLHPPTPSVSGTCILTGLPPYKSFSSKPGM